jgi:hypothetical protein
LPSIAIGLGASIETLLGEGGGFHQSSKQPLLGEFWSPYHNKNQSIHPINSYVFIDALGLVVNALLCLQQLLV